MLKDRRHHFNVRIEGILGLLFDPLLTVGESRSVVTEASGKYLRRNLSAITSNLLLTILTSVDIPKISKGSYHQEVSQLAIVLQ